VSGEYRVDACVECGVWLNVVAHFWPSVPVCCFDEFSILQNAFSWPFYVLVLLNKNFGLQFALESVFMVHDTFRTQSGYFYISPHKHENE
jgi:hypothetical protein